MTLSDFQKTWLSHFAASIPKANLQKYVVSTGNYIWHIFSWKLLPDGSYLEGDAARMAFEQIDKQDAIYIEAFGVNVCKTLPPELYHPESLDQFVEVYVAARDFSWTYIKTHEPYCGPYFCHNV